MVARKKLSYDELIAKMNEELVNLQEKQKQSNEEYKLKIKEKKNEIKQLEKDKLKYEKLKEEEEKKRTMNEIVSMIMESGKTMEEIKELLAK